MSSVNPVGGTTPSNLTNPLSGQQNEEDKKPHDFLGLGATADRDSKDIQDHLNQQKNSQPIA